MSVKMVLAALALVLVATATAQPILPDYPSIRIPTIPEEKGIDLLSLVVGFAAGVVVTVIVILFWILFK